MSVLVVYAHAAPGGSRHNRALLAAARRVAGVRVHDLTEHYPGWNIDVELETALLEEHDTIVFQCPMHWYSVPGLLKRWFDEAFAYGFAYGPGGDRLHGKRCWIAMTVSGSEDSYGGAGRQEYDVEYDLPTLLAGVRQSVLVTGMVWDPPFIVPRTVWYGLSDAELAGYAGAYAERLATSARVDRVDRRGARGIGSPIASARTEWVAQRRTAAPDDSA